MSDQLPRDDSRDGGRVDRRTREYREQMARDVDPMRQQTVKSDDLRDDPLRERPISLNFSPTVLPKPPEIPGFHVFWASTQSEAGNPHVMENEPWCYQIVPREEAEQHGFKWRQDVKDSSADQNWVRVREMVMMKVPTWRRKAIEKFEQDKADAMERQIYEPAFHERDRAGRSLVQNLTQDNRIRPRSD